MGRCGEVVVARGGPADDYRAGGWPCASSRLPGQILSAANARTAVRRAPRTSRGKNTSVKLLISPESWQIFRQPTSHCLAWQSDDRMLFECFHSTANDGQRLDSEQLLPPASRPSIPRDQLRTLHS